jgi:hypothetical protein
MSPTTWTEADTERAQAIWTEYQWRHEVSTQLGKTAGIDPSSGRVWFGESAADIRRQRRAEGAATPGDSARVGYDYGLGKGSHR